MYTVEVINVFHSDKSFDVNYASEAEAQKRFDSEVDKAEQLITMHPVDFQISLWHNTKRLVRTVDVCVSTVDGS